MTDRELFLAAEKAKERAYIPYSGYAVGAALEAENDKGDTAVFLGANVENGSYGATICAERTACVKAVTEGYRNLRKIAVAADGEEASLCGICRQFLSEFNPVLEVITGESADTLHMTTLDRLLPGHFHFEKGRGESGAAE